MTSDAVWAFKYDVENRWVHATDGSTKVDLNYDPAGRLQRLKADGSATQFLYDGDALVVEYSGTSMLRRYVHGPGIDEPIVEYVGAGTTDRRWLLTDHQGSVIGESNASGTVMEVYSYGPYGEPNVLTGSRFRYYLPDPHPGSRPLSLQGPRLLTLPRPLPADGSCWIQGSGEPLRLRR